MQHYFFFFNSLHIILNRISLVKVINAKMIQILSTSKTFDKIPNHFSLIDAEKPKKRSSTGMDWNDFHTLDEIYTWLDDIVKRYPDIVTPFNIGYSYEDRLIKGIKISYKPGNKAVFIESNIHAREWITSSTITYIIDELLVPRNPGVRKMAESVDWWIIPVLNVDGFVYSHEHVSNLNNSLKGISLEFCSFF